MIVDDGSSYEVLKFKFKKSETEESVKLKWLQEVGET